MSDPVSTLPRWKRLMRHPLFPLLVYLVLTQLIRENYPFSHYPMYSKPLPGPLNIYFLADDANQPLPILWYTGISASKVAKLQGNRKKKYRDETAAAADVLRYLRQANAGRRGRELPPRIRLVEAKVSFEDGRVVETQRALVEDSTPLKPRS